MLKFLIGLISSILICICVGKAISGGVSVGPTQTPTVTPVPTPVPMGIVTTGTAVTLSAPVSLSGTAVAAGLTGTVTAKNPANNTITITLSNGNVLILDDTAQFSNLLQKKVGP